MKRAKALTARPAPPSKPKNKAEIAAGSGHHHPKLKECRAQPPSCWPVGVSGQGAILTDAERLAEIRDGLNKDEDAWCGIALADQRFLLERVDKYEAVLREIVEVNDNYDVSALAEKALKST